MKSETMGKRPANLEFPRRICTDDAAPGGRIYQREFDVVWRVAVKVHAGIFEKRRTGGILRHFLPACIENAKFAFGENDYLLRNKSARDRYCRSENEKPWDIHAIRGG
jgi:hypothetical protein